MKRFPAVFALTALAAATVALAQQAPPPADPPASTAPQEQSPNATTEPSDSNAAADPNASANPNASAKSENRREALMKDCVTQIAAANPGVPARDVNNFCEKEVNQLSQPQPQN